MRELLGSSLYFGMVISVGTYLFGVWLRKKVPLAILNPLLVSIILTIGILLVFRIDYQDYNEGAKYLSYFLTPATVCLAIPLYKQLELLRHHAAAVIGGIVSGVAASAFSIFALAKLFGLSHEQPCNRGSRTSDCHRGASGVRIDIEGIWDEAKCRLNQPGTYARIN